MQLLTEYLENKLFLEESRRCWSTLRYDTMPTKLESKGKWWYCSVLYAGSKHSKTVPSFLAVVHFCEIYWCSFFRNSLVIFKLKFDGRGFVAKLVHDWLLKYNVGFLLKFCEIALVSYIKLVLNYFVLEYKFFLWRMVMSKFDKSVIRYLFGCQA